MKISRRGLFGTVLGGVLTGVLGELGFPIKTKMGLLEYAKRHFGKEYQARKHAENLEKAYLSPEDFGLKTKEIKTPYGNITVVEHPLLEKDEWHATTGI